MRSVCRPLARFDQLETRFDHLKDEMRTGFIEIRGALDQTAGGRQQIIDMLTTITSGRGDQ